MHIGHPPRFLIACTPLSYEPVLPNRTKKIGQAVDELHFF
ncbi:hypothetical protein CLOSTMETH_02789 [[Clostridium] methylpentosum DSM 5476]|uniref:Uncharacterized protein n=1 Tax=[Clostridium] methylpentosum DSM 5476 TaxID=537013 RepID=C0EFZ8_9FIRM|nr:hypothetical protein CLOSTMETH_02789 [[Clostridium] methylpentosum DSM 5476]